MAGPSRWAPFQSWIGASVMPVALDPRFGRAYFLLGLETYDEWSDFGGRAEFRDRDPEDTAARELEEETLGVLGRHAEWATRLRARDYVYRLDIRYDSARRFVCFVVLVPWDPASVSAYTQRRKRKARAEKRRIEYVSVNRIWDALSFSRSRLATASSGEDLVLRPAVRVVLHAVLELFREDPASRAFAFLPTVLHAGYSTSYRVLDSESESESESESGSGTL